MWTDSIKWRETHKNGGRGIVRFDVFCDACGKQLGEDVDDPTCKGLHVDKPMTCFCNLDCAKAWQKTNNKTLMMYGYTRLI